MLKITSATVLLSRIFAFSIFSLVFLVSGCTAKSPFPIDAEKTAQAPWAVGEVVKEFTSICIKNAEQKQCPYQRKFLGITSDGHYVVQEFYSVNGQKRTSPYLFTHKEALDLNDPEMAGYIVGSMTSWHLNGQKWGSFSVLNGNYEGEVLLWAENGQLIAQKYVIDGKLHGLCKQWYPSGAPESDSLYQEGELVAYVFWDEDGKVTDSHGSF